MKIEKVTLNRKFNLGNYETLDCGFEASVTEQDNPLDVLKGLEDMAELYLQARTMKTTVAEAIKPKPQPKAEFKMPVGEIAEKFPEDLRQHLTITADTIKTEFVSRDKWLKMDEIARGLGYKYVSEKKNCRWQKRCILPVT